MKHGSTLFLKTIIYLMGLAVLFLCIILIGVMYGGKPGIHIPIMLVSLLTAAPFFYALFQGLRLLTYIDRNTAFSEQSVQAIKVIKVCAASISALYALSMPYIVYVADKDDAPGEALIFLVLIFAPLVTCVFAAVLEKLLQNAVGLKSENDLTV